MKEITKCNERQAGLFLIEQHTIGRHLRDESDLINAQHHANETVSFAIDILKNIKGTNDEKISFLLKTQEEIPKFKAKK